MGLVDMASAIRPRGPERSSGAMVPRSPELMEGILQSATEGRFVSRRTTCERQAPIPADF